MFFLVAFATSTRIRRHNRGIDLPSSRLISHPSSAPMSPAEPLPAFFCPIEREMMTHPVICADGQTYERHAIEAWFARGKMTSPSTGAALAHTTLTQNIVLRNAIEEWLESHAMHLRKADIEMEGRPFAVGSFKNVYRGSLRITVPGGTSKRVIVAVLKMRRGDCAMEARMLLKIGRHPRVVRFLGQCVDGEDQLLITEFAPLGSLTDALETLGNKFTLAHSVVIMQQIAQAMEHLASEGIIHRDLAARNVLVFAFDENDVPSMSVKLSDYGMAVGCYNRTHVSHASGDKPIRYMPPEALRRARFSEKSDVWAFGVLCWEILTLGDIPYFEILEERVITHVCDGGRLQLVGDSQLVAACPDALWSLIKSCWCTSTEDRPGFSGVVTALGSMSAQMALHRAVRAEALLAEERLEREKLARNKTDLEDQLRVAQEKKEEEEAKFRPSAAFMSNQPSIFKNPPRSPSPTVQPKASTSWFKAAKKHCMQCGTASTKVDRPKCKSCGSTFWKLQAVAASEVESSLDGLFLDEKKEAVAKWLGSINMGQYSSRFIVYGYDSMEILVQADEKDVMEMMEDASIDMKKPHRNPFLKAWKAHKAAAEAKDAAAAAAAAAAAERKRKEEERAAAAEEACRETPLLGRRVVINGLVAKPELNGRTGTAVSFDDDKGRYSVELDDASSSFMIKPCNLLPTAAAEARAAVALLKPLEAQGDATALIQAMRARPNREPVQKAACQALANLARDDDGMRVKIAAAGGIETVIAAMTAHKTSAGVQEKACAALRNLSVNRDNQVAVAAASGIETVIVAMTAHKTSAGVQEHACGALRNLTVNADNRVTISAAGGIEALATAMTTHQASALLQENTCAALHNLALNASLRGRIKAAGGVELAKRAVSASDATGKTKDCGKRLLDKLA